MYIDIILNSLTIFIICLLIIIIFYNSNKSSSNIDQNLLISGPTGPNIGPTGPTGAMGKTIYNENQLSQIPDKFFGPTGLIGPPGIIITDPSYTGSTCSDINIPYQSKSITLVDNLNSNSFLEFFSNYLSYYTNINTYLVVSQAKNDIDDRDIIITIEPNFYCGKINIGDYFIIDTSAYGDYKFGSTNQQEFINSSNILSIIVNGTEITLNNLINLEENKVNYFYVLFYDSNLKNLYLTYSSTNNKSN